MYIHHHHHHHHHHIPPWIRSFELFRHRRIAIVSWGIHDLLFLEVCSWGRCFGSLVLSILSRWLIQICLYLSITSCIPEISGSFLITSICIYLWTYVCMYVCILSSWVNSPSQTLEYGTSSTPCRTPEFSPNLTNWNWDFIQLQMKLKILLFIHDTNKCTLDTKIYILTLFPYVSASFTTSSSSSVKWKVVGVMNEKFSQDAQNKRGQNRNSRFNSRS